MSDYDDILLEHVWHEMKAIREGQESLAHLPAAVARLQEDMTEVKTDIKVIKAVVTDHSSQLRNHETRIRTLEQAA